MSLTLHAATGEGRRHSAAVREPGPIQAPEDDSVGKQGYVRGGLVGLTFCARMCEVGMCMSLWEPRVSGAGGACDGV